MVLSNIERIYGTAAFLASCIYILFIYMPSILIHLDEPLLQALNKVAPTSTRKRADFIRSAVREAIRRREYEQMREAYRKQPDAATDADDWSNAEEWKP